MKKSKRVWSIDLALLFSSCQSAFLIFEIQILIHFYALSSREKKIFKLDSSLHRLHWNVPIAYHSILLQSEIQISKNFFEMCWLLWHYLRFCFLHASGFAWADNVVFKSDGHSRMSPGPSKIEGQGVIVPHPPPHILAYKLALIRVGGHIMSKVIIDKSHGEVTQLKMLIHTF